VIFLTDAESESRQDDLKAQILKELPPKCAVLELVNKADLLQDASKIATADALLISAKTGVGIFLQNKLIYKGTYDSERRLFQINIMDLILPSSPPHYPQISDDALVASNIPLRVSRDESEADEPEHKAGAQLPLAERKMRSKPKLLIQL
jgi:hypothetical protein